MDPNALLEAIRANVAALLSAAEDDDTFTGVELARQVADLDEWISKGGFLPLPWCPRSEAMPGSW